MRERKIEGRGEEEGKERGRERKEEKRERKEREKTETRNNIYYPSRAIAIVLVHQRGWLVSFLTPIRTSGAFIQC